MSEMKAPIPVLRIFDEAKAREFYLDFLGFSVDWEHRFEDDAPLYMQVSRGACVLHLSEHFGEDVYKRQLLAAGKLNMLRMLFHPAGVRHAIVNWEEVARATIGRVHRDLHHRADDRRMATLLDEVLTYPDVPRDFRQLDLSERPSLLIDVHFRLDEFEVKTFSTITTLGTAQDVTLQEIAIEVFFPADDASDATMKALAEA